MTANTDIRPRKLPVSASDSLGAQPTSAARLMTQNAAVERNAAVEQNAAVDPTSAALARFRRAARPPHLTARRAHPNVRLRMESGHARGSVQSGAVLGNYRVLDRLGAGGMGVVYLGRHEALGHSVAIKVLQPELSSNESMVRRFFHEAQAATSIRNPGIVQIFDFGTSPTGAVYFVMELLEGTPLSSRLAKGPLPSAVGCRIARQIATVLEAAHRRGIVHRDLKPDNLFLVPDPEVPGGERVKVLDFGIAKLASDAQTLGLRTNTGLILGTPFYLKHPLISRRRQCERFRDDGPRHRVP
jgi:serine/threonine protein kinase